MNETPTEIQTLGHGLWVDPPPPHRITILLVDDEPDLRSLLARVLRREGYQIVAAADGREALNLFAEPADFPVHLLITDLDMPHLGGLDLARYLRATNRVQRVIFMTGDMQQIDSQVPEHQALLQKPFPPSLLTQVVNQVLTQV